MGGGPDPSDQGPSSLESALSVHSTESMVEIKRARAAESISSSVLEEQKYQLMFSRSKVYIHPTLYSRDNIPGFVTVVKKDGLNPTYLVAWIPESLLDENGPGEWEKFVRVESVPSAEEDTDDVVLINMPSHRPESYAFSVPIPSIYSLIVHPPTLSSWYGSVSIHLSSGTTLPTLYFHDDESRSIQFPQNGSSRATASWGGEDLLQRLRLYANLLRSTLQSNLFLVDPSRADIETHTTILYSDDAVDAILSPSSPSSSSPVPAHRRPRHQSLPATPRTSLLHHSLAPPSPGSQARAALLQSFSHLTRATKTTAQRILSHPLARPIVPHLPDPVKSLVSVNGEWASWVEKGGVGEFESARVYLARWARIVAEEGERARQREAQATSTPGSSSDEESSDLGVFELLHKSSNLPSPKTTRDPRHPIDRRKWDLWFDATTGEPKISLEEMRLEVFQHGLAADVRRKAWPFIVGVLPWNVDSRTRDMLWKAKVAEYEDIKNEWCGVDEVFNREDVVEERHRIDVDCRRTDRTQPLFVTPVTPPGEAATGDEVYTFSPRSDETGAQAASNEHVERLASILLTYNFYEKDLGYVQGMSDICSPIYVVTGADEAMTFWCFVAVMERMKKNFLRDQSGMRKQLLTLQQLIAVTDPELYRHLEKTESLNLFFSFRWVLIAFKREFSFDDILRLWEVLWTDYYSNQFVLFVALAVLESHRDVILRYLVEFDEILKYCNELSMTIELDSTLAQAEVLFLSFAQLVADIDRRKVEQDDLAGEGLRRRKGAQQSTKVGLPVISENLRELLLR